MQDENVVTRLSAKSLISLFRVWNCNFQPSSGTSFQTSALTALSCCY